MAQDDLTELSGVGPATADKLSDAGFETYLSVATASPGDLGDKADIGESTAQTVIQSARQEADVGGFDSGSEVLDQRREIGKISMHIDEFDSLMGGGIETQAITEFYGKFGSGKSQFTHQLAVNIQLPYDAGGMHGSAIFIDTEDSFRPERISEMVQGLPEDALEAAIEEEDGIDYTVDEIKDSETNEGGDPVDGTPAAELSERFLDRIMVADAFNSNHQIMLAEKALDVAQEKSDNDYPIRLVAVDSLMAHFRSEYVGRGELAERQQKINRHLHDLKKIGNLHNAAVLIANQVAANPDSYFGDPTNPIGGNIVGHTSTFRIYVKNSKANKRIAKLVDAPNLEDGEAVVRIEGEGVKPE